MEPYYRKDRDAALWLEMPISIKRWQAYFIKEYSLQSTHLFFIPIYYSPSGGSQTRKIQRNFLWEASKDAFKYPLVAWEKVCSPVEDGGLGIWRVGLFDQALLCKWLWLFGKESIGYGVKLLQPSMVRLDEAGAPEL